MVKMENKLHTWENFKEYVYLILIDDFIKILLLVYVMEVLGLDVKDNSYLYELISCHEVVHVAKQVQPTFSISNILVDINLFDVVS